MWLKKFLPITRYVWPYLLHTGPWRGRRPNRYVCRSAQVKADFACRFENNWRVTRDLAQDVSRLEVVNDNGLQYIKDIDLAMGRSAKEWYTYQGDDFNSVKGETLCERRFSRGVWSIRTVTRTVLTSTREAFFLRAELDAYEGDKRIYSENWDHIIPRDLV